MNHGHDSFIRTSGRRAGVEVENASGVFQGALAPSSARAGLDARAPTQPHGLAFADQDTFQATLDERTCGYGVCVRSIQ
jgi:hypothetical protein